MEANISPRIYEHCKIQQHETHLASPIRSKGSPATKSCSVRLQPRTQSNCIKIHQEYQCLIQRAYQAIYITRLSSITYPDKCSSSQGIQVSEAPVLPSVQFSKKIYLWGLVDNKLKSGRSPWVQFNWQHYNPTVTHTTHRCHLVYVHHLKTDRWQKSLQKLVICTWGHCNSHKKGANFRNTPSTHIFFVTHWGASASKNANPESSRTIPQKKQMRSCTTKLNNSS